MPRHLPPLNGLRAFEAVGRHLSLSAAAAELFVTPAAVSQQVKALERHLGLALVRRRGRGLALTDAGQRLLPGLTEGLDRLDGAVAAVRDRAARRPLTVSVPASFGARWLVPRLERFRAAHPEVEVRIDASSRPVSFAGEDIDLVIRYGPMPAPGLRIERLLDEEVFPVCSPRLLTGPRTLREPADLARHTLLHTEKSVPGERRPDWRAWLRAAGLEHVDATRGPRFTLSTMALQAAVAGQGVALASSLLVAEELASGMLVRPFPLGVPAAHAYCLAYPESHAAQPKIAAFREWLLAEARGETEAERR